MGKKAINLNRFSMIASLCLLSVFLCITLLVPMVSSIRNIVPKEKVCY